MSKSMKEQLEAVKSIMTKPEKGKRKSSYSLKGKTFMLKDDLKAWGWYWNHEAKYWALDDVYEDDPSLRIVQGIEGTWIDKVER